MLVNRDNSPCQKLVPLKIISTGVALPENKLSSYELDIRLNKKAGYVEQRSGIVHRYHADYNASQAELGVAALNDALQRQCIDPASIDLLIYASAIAVQALPYSACHLLKASTLSQGIACFDVNSSCVSFIVALQIGASLVNSGTYQRVAIVSSELASRGIDWRDEESSLIFGDGAACAIIEKGDGQSGIVNCLLETYTQGIDLCEIRAGGTLKNPRAGMVEDDFLFHMQGKRLFRLASSLFDGYWQRLLTASGYTLEQIATVIPHQASHLSLEHMRKRLNVPSEKLIDIYRYHGNQVSASLPTALHYANMEQRLPAGHPVVLVGTAAGLTLGGMVLIP